MAPGSYTGTQSVSISTVTTGTTIRYTTDGSTPTGTTGTVYTGPISLSANTTLKAVACKSGLIDSLVATGVYTINAPPTVSLTAPANNTVYATSPATVAMTATASDTDGTISKVVFYNGGTLLGTDSTSPYSYTWSNVAASGSSGLSLTAVATDNNGATTTSAAVTGTITDSALKCYWKLNESSGTTASDASGTGNAGTTYNSPTWTACKIANGLSFNGSNQYAEKSSASSLPAANATQTECCWVYVSSNPTAQKTALCVTGSSSGVYLGFNSQTAFGVWKYGGTALVTTTSLPAAGQWHHVAYVKNGSTNYLYIDGVQAATSTTSTNTAAATTVDADRSPIGSYYWPGKVDEVCIYTRALSAAEIQALAAGKQ